MRVCARWSTPHAAPPHRTPDRTGPFTLPPRLVRDRCREQQAQAEAAAARAEARRASQEAARALAEAQAARATARLAPAASELAPPAPLEAPALDDGPARPQEERPGGGVLGLLNVLGLGAGGALGGYVSVLQSRKQVLRRS